RPSDGEYAPLVRGDHARYPRRLRTRSGGRSMTSSMDAAADQTHGMLQEVAGHWGLAVVLGVLSIILGLLAIAYPGRTVVIVAIFFAAWLFVTGIYEV